MTPFPEGEDMTVKRLQVALKRGDEQLLKTGAHKLHEKYHSGFEFRLIDDLRGILKSLEEQKVPNDIKDLLVRTITNIVNGVRPDYSTGLQSQTVQNTASALQPTIQIQSQSPVQTPLGTLPMQSASAVQQMAQQTAQVNTIRPNLEERSITADFTAIQPTNQAAQQTVQLTPAAPVQEAQETIPQQIYSASQTVEEYQPAMQTYPADRDIVVFYDDKAGFVDYDKNKNYRLDLLEFGMNRDVNPINLALQVKSSADTRTDEAQDALRTLKNLRGKIDFVTTSKSANILKTFKDLGIKFNLAGTMKKEQGAQMTIYPLFGLSNLFICPKCGRREYFIDDENKVLSLQCSNCASSMFPDITEAKDFETNAVPNVWMKSLLNMSKSDVWVLINPPLESSRALTCEFLRTAFELCNPKKVCIVTKEIAIKEYYRQMLRETVPNCEVKSEFANMDILLTEVTKKDMALQAV